MRSFRPIAGPLGAKDGAFSICKACEAIDRKRRAETKKAETGKAAAPAPKPRRSRKAADAG